MLDDSSEVIILTDREREVLQLSAHGFTKQDISQFIQLSPHTVDQHRRNAMRKTGGSNITAAVIIAMKKGVITV